MRAVAAILVAAVLLAHWPEASGWLTCDPMLWTARLSRAEPLSFLPGSRGWNDPNAGLTLQALGGTAAAQWLHGAVPWWNPYGGIGLPLAAEMQNAAMFMPFVLLLQLPNGLLALKLVLQLIAGFAAYALLRQLGLRRLSASVGAVCFALNGTFALMGHGPILPVAALPVMLLGIERSVAAARRGAAGGWAWLAVGLAYTVLAGFPETSFLEAMFAATWAVLRLVQARHGAWRAVSAKLLAGGGVGLLLTAPLVWSFLQALPSSLVGVHAASSGPFLLPRRELALFLTPFAFGPIDFAAQWIESGLMGGYIQLGLLPPALLGLVVGRRERALRWTLAAWGLVMLADMLGPAALGHALGLIPFFGRIIVERYIWPTWEMSLVILAALAIEDWRDGRLGTPAGRLAVIVASGAAAAIGLGFGLPHIRHVLLGVPGYPAYLAGSIAGMLIVLTLVAVFFVPTPSRRRGMLLGAVLVAEAIALCSFPTLSGTRQAAPDWEAVRFLRRNLGLARFVTLGPIAPNYGALFGLASVNEDYFPVLRVWADYVERHLFPGAGISFDAYGATGADLSRALPPRIAAFEAVGVKYVVAFRGTAPFAGMAMPPALAFRGREIDIYALPSPAPYFTAAGGPCTLTPEGRAVVTADCAAPARLIRRELFVRGWTARIDGRAAPVRSDSEIFQAVSVPAGRSRVTFAYAPPGIGWAWAGFVLGAVWLVAGLIGPARDLPRRVRAVAAAGEGR